MDKEELIKTARLARLKLSEREHSEFTEQLKEILAYFKKISSVDTEGVLPLVYPLDGMESSDSFLREDNVQLKKEEKQELLALAPERLGDEYKVPPVVD